MEHPEIKHPYITTVSGQNVGQPLVGFAPKHVRFDDIAHALALQCRYNGHVDRFYSVGEHSVLVSRIAELVGDSEARLPALFHDAHEAYMGDIAAPQKRMIGPGMIQFEADMEQVVRTALHLPPATDPVWQRVREYDSAILHREVRCLRRILPDWYDHEMEGKVPQEVLPMGLEWYPAKQFFIQRALSLGFSPSFP